MSDTHITEIDAMIKNIVFNEAIVNNQINKNKKNRVIINNLPSVQNCMKTADVMKLINLHLQQYKTLNDILKNFIDHKVEEYSIYHKEFEFRLIEENFTK